MNNFMLFALLEIGGDNIKVSDAGSTIGGLNDILKSLGIAVGVIIITVAVVKLIIGLAQERPDQVSQSSLMFGVGIVFASLSAVLTTLGVEDITESTKATTVAANVLDVIAALLTCSGAVITVIAIIYLIMAIAQEQPESKVTGTKMLGIAIGLISARSLARKMRVRVFSSTTTVKTYLQDILGFIANVVTYIGAGFIVMAVWYLIESMKSEDSKERETARRFFIVGIGLISIRVIISTVTGITPTQTFYGVSG